MSGNTGWATLQEHGGNLIRKATLPMETIFPDRVRPTHSQYCPEVWTPAVPTPSSQQTWRHRLATTCQAVHQLSPLPGSVVLSPFSDYYLLSTPLYSALSPGPSGLGVLICHMGGKRAAGHVGEASFGPKEKNKGGELLPFHLTPPRGKANPTRATTSAEKCQQDPCCLCHQDRPSCLSLPSSKRQGRLSLWQRMMEVSAPTRLIT